MFKDRNCFGRREFDCFDKRTHFDTLVRTCIAVEIICWFFVGEAIGRRSFAGYIVPANYVDKKLTNMMKHHKDNTCDIPPKA
ncbi:unnamed protein product [Brugia timori]|uniref:Transmembrane protein n=1 Tax=Brugia timori TaxID=42155 RepID=A0A0R3QEM2_9BILA|nr:unnamed protein product [Brugia timori]